MKKEIFNLLWGNLEQRRKWNEQCEDSGRRRYPFNWAIEDMRRDSRTIAAATFVESHYRMGKRIPAINCTQKDVLEFCVNALDGVYD